MELDKDSGMGLDRTMEMEPRKEYLISECCTKAVTKYIKTHANFERQWENINNEMKEDLLMAAIERYKTNPSQKTDKALSDKEISRKIRDQARVIYKREIMKIRQAELQVKRQERALRGPPRLLPNVLRGEAQQDPNRLDVPDVAKTSSEPKSHRLNASETEILSKTAPVSKVYTESLTEDTPGAKIVTVEDTHTVSGVPTFSGRQSFSRIRIQDIIDP